MPFIRKNFTPLFIVLLNGCATSKFGNVEIYEDKTDITFELQQNEINSYYY